MKRIITNSLLLLLLISLSYQTIAQVQYNNCSTTGTNASAIGNKTSAGGNNSLAGGYSSKANGSNSLAFGYNCSSSGTTTTAIGNTAVTTSTGSMALGNYVKAAAPYTYVFGSGTTASYPLTNSTSYSIAMGINSNIPTMLITKSKNNNFTGKVAIGPVTSPQAKLHIKSDNNEDAELMIEVSNKSNDKASVSLFDKNHFIAVGPNIDMQFHAEEGVIKLEGDHYCFGKEHEKKARLYTNKTPTLYVNAVRSDAGENNEDSGPSYAIGFNDHGLLFSSAMNKKGNEAKQIDWKNIMYLLNDGKIGIGSESTYLRNNDDHTLEVHAPRNLNLESDKIMLSGKIGINTTNDVTDYALAVNGGIISTKVYIKEVNQWPDYVFSDTYSLMDLDDLKHYLAVNRHLPGLPSEEEVLESGYDMGEMQANLLRKIEELTRYVLFLQDEIVTLKRENKTSEDTIVFTYDSNGNRISRHLVFERITKHDSPTQASIPSAYSLFPNPTSGTFSLQLDKPEQGEMLRATLLDVSGTILETKETKDGRIEFDLTRQPGGIYILEVDGAAGRDTWKVIKK